MHAAALIGSSWLFYAQQRLLIDFTFPLLSTTLLYLTLIFSSFAREQKQRRRIRSAFSQYLSPALVEQLAQSPEKLVLGGEERDMTIMFSDVRGFTAISEAYRHDPHGLTTLMNRLLTPLTDAIIARNGTIDKYVGDMVMALFGAPLDDPDHADHAVETALDMVAELGRLNERWAAEGRPPLDIGIGVNTGPMIAGNIGSEAIMSYTVIGDAVNLGARLESLNKQYGTRIIISEATRQQLKRRYTLRPLGDVIVKGKSQAVSIYEVVGRDA